MIFCDHADYTSWKTIHHERPYNHFFLHFFIDIIKGHASDSYHRIKINFRGDKFLIYAHQLAYWVNNDFSGLLDETKQLSHLCHVKNCTNPAHITFETPQLNNARKICNREKICSGHGDAVPDCIL